MVKILFAHSLICPNSDVLVNDMKHDFIRASYVIETPYDPVHVAEVMAGEQSCGTFTRVHNETDELRARARANVVSIKELESVASPSLPNFWIERQQRDISVYRRALIDIEFPVANLGSNLTTLAATVSGNLFDLGEVTGLRLENVTFSSDYRRRFSLPVAGIAGTRQQTGVAQGALVGTIIKPNVGMRAEETAQLVKQLCDAGVDFIKDDEICADPDHAPLAERVPAVMRVIRAHRERTGKQVMMAFNISDETEAMIRHAALIEREGGNCAMVSLNWCGFAAVQTLRKHTNLVLHGHRNGYGAFARHPLLGIGFEAYQAMWRLAGVDHMHVHGLQGKFSQTDDEVVMSAKACLSPLANDVDDRVMPAFSSGQWAGTVPVTWDAVKTDDLLFMSGGGILAHPGGAAAGVTSIRQAWDAARQGIALNDYAQHAPELAAALAFFNKTK
jgi:ribulose-bisphosphate carboxylase large chain